MKRPSRDCCAELIAAIDAYVEKADKDFIEQIKKAGYKLPAQTLDLIDKLAKQLSQGGEGIARSIVANLKNVVDLPVWIASQGGCDLAALLLVDRTERKNRLRRNENLFKRSFEEFMPLLIQNYSAEIDNQLAITAVTKRTQAWMNEWPQKVAGFIEQGIQNDLEDILRKALRKGESIDKVTRCIMDSDIRNPEWKARRMALTEMLRAHSYAQLEAYRTNPAVERKRWMHSGAKFSDARENHVALNGTIVGVNDYFTIPVSGERCQCPRDSTLSAKESVNCHCLIQPVVNDDILGLPLKERERLYREAVAKDNREWEKELDKERQREAAIHRNEISPEITVRRLNGAGTTDIDFGLIANLGDLKHIVKDVNPNYSLGTEAWTHNCQRCVATMEVRSRGYNVAAKPKLPNVQDPFFNGTMNWKAPYHNPKVVNCAAAAWKDSKVLVDAEVKSWGTDSRGIVYVAWPPDPITGLREAHVFTAVNDSGRIRYIDAQTGSLDASSYFQHADPKYTSVFRVDNLELTEAIQECCKKK